MNICVAATEKTEGNLETHTTSKLDAFCWGCIKVPLRDRDKVGTWKEALLPVICTRQEHLPGNKGNLHFVKIETHLRQHRQWKGYAHDTA